MTSSGWRGNRRRPLARLPLFRPARVSERRAGFPTCGWRVAQHDPSGRVIARTFEPPHLAVDAGVNQALCGFGIQQQMIDAKSGIAFPAVSFVIPERVHRRIRMQRADRIDPSLIE